MALRLPKTKGMLRREAATWLSRLQSGRDPEVERKFRQWYQGDERHAAAFDRVRRSYEQAGLLRHSAVPGDDGQRSMREPRRQLRPALAAALAAIVLVPLGVILVRSNAALFGSTEAVMLMTKVGEIRQVELADGSKVTLDTGTKMDVEIGHSRRAAHLRYGRARFEVAASAVPFVVDTAATIVSTRQGVIDVEQGPQQDHVEVLAGTADVRGMALAAGQGAAVGAGGAERTNGVAPASAWTRGMLQFDGTPLADAVALANRYSDRHIVVVGDLKALRVTGAFRAGDTAGLAKALAAAFGLSLDQPAGGDLILSPSAPARRQKKKGG